MLSCGCGDPRRPRCATPCKSGRWKANHKLSHYLSYIAMRVVFSGDTGLYLCKGDVACAAVCHVRKAYTAQERNQEEQNRCARTEQGRGQPRSQRGREDDSAWGRVWGTHRRPALRLINPAISQGSTSIGIILLFHVFYFRPKIFHTSPVQL